MKSKKEFPPIINPVFAATFNQMFGAPVPKKATKDTKPKGKKGGKGERGND